MKLDANEALKNWIQLYSESLIQRAVYLLSDKEEALDLVQDVFLAAYSSYQDFQEKSSPHTWLNNILNNKVADFYRKKYKHPVSVNFDYFFDETGSWRNDDVLNDWDYDSENILDNKDFNKSLEECLDELPQRWKLPVKLYYLQEKKAPEVCQEMGFTSTNLWKILQRSRLQLRECLEFNWFGKT